MDLITLCARLTAKFLTTAYKSKIIRFKIDEVRLQHLIYFLTFVESLEMKFSHYTKTCEVLLDDPKIGGENMKYFVRKAIRNVLHANIDVHSRRLVADFPIDGIKFIENCNNIVQT